MEEDDEIIFENSVLHQTLIESGCVDIETVPRSLENCASPQDKTNDSWKNDNSYNSDESIVSYLTCNPLTSLFFPAQALEQLYGQQRSHTLKHLVKSQLLSEEDQFFLGYLIEDNELWDIRGLDISSKWIVQFIGCCTIIMLVSNVVAGLLKWPSWLVMLMPSCQLLTYIDPCFHGLLVILFNIFLICVLIIPVMVIKYTIRKQILNELKERDKAIKDLEVQAWELMYLERKCLRHIKETELVARGFTFASQYKAGLSACLKHSGITNEQDLQLRETLFLENINLMTVIKKHVIKMMQSVPLLCKDSDFGSLESIEIQPDFEPESLKSDEDKLEISGSGIYSITVAQLNKSVSLLNVYLSGLIRRLALCFYVKNYRDASIEPFSSTKECVCRSLEAIMKSQSTLVHCYRFSEAMYRCDSKKVRAAPKTQVSELFNSIRDLDMQLRNTLHETGKLKSLLEARVHQAERRLCGIEDGDASDVVNEQDKNSWTAAMKKIKENIESVRNCQEEVVQHLSKYTHQAIPAHAVTSVVKKSTKFEEPRVTYVKLDENIIVDQVFEAVITDDDVNETQNMPKYSPEEQVKSKAQKETLKMLTQELHAVVGQIAISWREREEIALARARGETTNLTCQDNTLTCLNKTSASPSLDGNEGDIGSSYQATNLASQNEAIKSEYKTSPSSVYEKKENYMGFSHQACIEKIPAEIHSSHVQTYKKCSEETCLSTSSIDQRISFIAETCTSNIFTDSEPFHKTDDEKSPGEVNHGVVSETFTSNTSDNEAIEDKIDEDRLKSFQFHLAFSKQIANEAVSTARSLYLLGNEEHFSDDSDSDVEELEEILNFDCENLQ